MNIRKRMWTWKGARAVAWQLDWNDGGKRRQKQFRTRHYEVLPKQRVEDPREKYLPKKKKR